MGMMSNKIILIIGLLVLKNNVEIGSGWMWWWMIVFTIISGFFEVGGVLGIAYVDRYVRVAQLALEGKSGGKEVSEEPREE